MVKGLHYKKYIVSYFLFSHHLPYTKQTRVIIKNFVQSFFSKGSSLVIRVFTPKTVIGEKNLFLINRDVQNGVVT